MIRVFLKWLAALARRPGLRPLAGALRRGLGDHRYSALRSSLLPVSSAISLSAQDGDLRPRLNEVSAPLLRVDHAWAIPDLGYLVVGWCLDPGRRLRSLLVESGGQRSQDLVANWVRLPRPDVLKAFPQLSNRDPKVGFIALAHVRVCGVAPRLEVDTAGFRPQYQLLPVREPGPAIEFSRAVLATFSLPHADLRRLIDAHIGPALERVWAAQAQPVPEPDVRWFGVPPVQPTGTVIVPLYGRYDFMRYQLALFADDAAMPGVELLYVVDDPRIHDAVLELAAEIQPLFRIPFAVVHAGRNLGFAGANNLGARVARGDLLLLVNSDLMPARAGWVEAARVALASIPEAGAIGAQLLYEDGSVQHEGMGTEPYAGWGGLQINTHPRKGFAPGAPGAPPRRVPAVTAAFLALKRKLYLELGGFDEGYILGDFEDSDLCRRIRERKLECFVLPDLDLYHLERQSQNLAGEAAWKSKLSLINAWRHERASSTVTA